MVRGGTVLVCGLGLLWASAAAFAAGQVNHGQGPGATVDSKAPNPGAAGPWLLQRKGSNERAAESASPTGPGPFHEPARLPGTGSGPPGQPTAGPAATAGTSNLTPSQTPGQTDAPAATPAAQGPGTPPAQQTANLTLNVTGPPKVRANQKADYLIVVRNAGPSPVTEVQVTAELPEGGKLVGSRPEAEVQDQTAVWKLGQLAPGQERSVKLQVQPGPGGKIACHATVVCSTQAMCQTAVTRPELEVALNGPPEVQVGTAVPYVVHLANSGTDAATGVIIRAQLPPGLSHPAGKEIEYEVGTLAAGQSRDIQLKLQATDIGLQQTIIEAACTQGAKGRAVSNLVITKPRLTVQKSGPPKRYVDRPATYTIVVQNPGTAQVENVTVQDEIPDGAVVLAASDGGQLSQDGRHIRWALEQIGPGESRSLNVTLRPTVAGKYTSKVVVADGTGVIAEAAAETLVEGFAALSLEVADLEDPVDVDAEATYEVRVTNQGTKAATGLSLTVLLPPGSELLKVEGPSKYKTEGPQVVFEPLPRLAARADVAYYVHVRHTKPGDQRFRVNLICDQLQSPVHVEQSTRVLGE